MGKPYQVVISPGVDFFLKQRDVLKLAEMGQEWALETIKLINVESSDSQIYLPSQDELPRHDRSLIELAETCKRLEVVELAVKLWPPKYFVINTSPMGGEEVFEPGTINWSTVYYPEDYETLPKRTDDEEMWAKIKAIAP